jgi:hypothetical protein
LKENPSVDVFESGAALIEMFSAVPISTERKSKRPRLLVFQQNSTRYPSMSQLWAPLDEIGFEIVLLRIVRNWTPLNSLPRSQ